MRIAILGWGSLLWDTTTPQAQEFDRHRGNWLFDGPRLRLEFSRISHSRNSALTLVLDYENGGEPSQVAYALSKRKHPEDAACDLRCREGTVMKNIGYHFAIANEPEKAP